MLKTTAITAAMILVLAGRAAGGTLTRVISDGVFDDWSAVPVAFADPAGDQNGAVSDIRNVWLANDEAYVYVRFEVGSLLHQDNARLNFYFDIDSDDTTGYSVRGIGSEFVLQFSDHDGAEQTSGTWEAATLGHSVLSYAASPTVGAVEYELRIRRDVVLPNRGTELFGGPDFDMIIEGQDSGGNSREWAPNSLNGHHYTLATGTLPPYATISLDRDNPAFVRMVTWNMLWGGLIKRPEPFNRILAALDPDIILFQEAAGIQWWEIRNRLNDILPLGGGGQWQVYWQNNNAVASRWSSSMWAGDTTPSTERGVAMALVDLPDAEYDTDLYVINVHYKCCGGIGGSEDDKRQTQSDALVNWFRDLREPGGNVNLPADTPILVAGDFNLVGSPQPLLTLLDGNIIDESTFGSDSSPDWDGSNLAEPVPAHNAAPAAYTWRSETGWYAPGRLDYVVYTDSVLSVAKSFVLNTEEMSAADLAANGLLGQDSADASDHFPIIVDFNLGAPEPAPGDIDADGDVDSDDLDLFVGVLVGLNQDPQHIGRSDLSLDGVANGIDVGLFVDEMVP